MSTSRTGTTRARTGSRTYRGVAEIGAPRLAGLPGVHDERPEPQQLLEMERYDTADRRLTAAGIALAVCRDGAQAVWQLDLPEGDGHERLRVPVVPADRFAPADPAGLPGGLELWLPPALEVTAPASAAAPP